MKTEEEEKCEKLQEPTILFFLFLSLSNFEEKK